MLHIKILLWRWILAEPIWGNHVIIYVNKTIMLYSLSLCKYIYQLIFNKSGKYEKIKNSLAKYPQID